MPERSTIGPAVIHLQHLSGLLLSRYMALFLVSICQPAAMNAPSVVLSHHMVFVVYIGPSVNTVWVESLVSMGVSIDAYSYSVPTSPPALFSMLLGVLRDRVLRY